MAPLSLRAKLFVLMSLLLLSSFKIVSPLFHPDSLGDCAVCVAVWTRYDFSAWNLWMKIQLFHAILFRIVLTVELCWGLENCLLQTPRYRGRKLASFAIYWTVSSYMLWTIKGAMGFLMITILSPYAKLARTDRSCWCFLMFLASGCYAYYEMFAFYGRPFARVWEIYNKTAWLQADPERTEIQADPKHPHLT